MMQQVSDRNWKERLRELARRPPDREITDAFVDAILSDKDLVCDIRKIAGQALDFREDKEERTFRRIRNQSIGKMRTELATRSAEALASDGLVIVAVFQRFPPPLDLPTAEST